MEQSWRKLLCQHPFRLPQEVVSHQGQAVTTVTPAMQCFSLCMAWSNTPPLTGSATSPSQKGVPCCSTWGVTPVTRACRGNKQHGQVVFDRL